MRRYISLNKVERIKLSEKLNSIIEKMQYILEGDPRTLSNRECENGWVFSSVYKCLKQLKLLEKEIKQESKEKFTLYVVKFKFNYYGCYDYPSILIYRKRSEAEQVLKDCGWYEDPEGRLRWFHPDHLKCDEAMIDEVEV